MDRVQAMEVFTRVIDANSFTRAAEQLALPRATVSTMVRSLESLLGVRLIHRTTRRLSITPEGAAYYEHCVRVLSDIAETAAGFQSGSRKPRGALRLHMPISLGRQLVIPSLHAFRNAYPDITFDIALSDRPIDPVEEGIDCMLKVGALEDSSLIARRIGTLKRITCAAPDYLDRHSEPETLDDLLGHHAVNFRSGYSGRPVPWSFLVAGKSVEVKMHGSVTVNDSEAYLDCGVRGYGLIQPLLFVASEHLRRGSLRRVLPGANPQPKPIYIFYSSNRHLPTKIRVFSDWIAELFGSMPEFFE
jgi:LysR family transcriptional regulator, regulator for bpeEF and oprC